jgi:anthranilate phosphoribosyltransferase
VPGRSGREAWPTLIHALLRGDELSTEDTAWAMSEIVSGEATAVQIAAFAVALRAKGETPGEIGGLVQGLLDAAVPVDLGATLGAELARDAVDVVGTGGDRAQTVNISTMAAMVVAAAGVRVVKHGNRAASSLCGTADLLEYLGVPLDLTPEQVATCVARVGIGFCFAPRFHSGLRHASVARKEMGVPTFFNFLGPLANPARPRAGAVGCADARMAGIMAEVFARRGDSVLVLHGEDGLDEFTITAPTRIWAVSDGAVSALTIDALDLGLPRGKPEDLRGGDASVNADVARRVLAGESGPVRDAVLANAAAAIVAYDNAAGAEDLAGALIAAIDRAATAIDSGAGTRTLETWVSTAQSLRS